jgi:mono/diheme cytochrome c family protein
MTRVRIALVLAGLMWTASTMLAGGWAVITVEDLPDVIEAGKTLPLTFTVRQHGTHSLAGLSPRVEAVIGSTKVSAAAAPAAKTGQYTANLTLPHAGDWSITIYSGFMTSKLSLLPIEAVARSSSHIAASSAELGRRLFVAKGCVTCHSNNMNSANESLNVGPALIAKKYQDDFLARVLENPSVLPPSRLPAGSMPNLNLQSKEITALVAFINEGMPSATTAQRQR